MSTVLDETVLEDRPEVDLSVLAALRAEREGPVVLAFDIGTSGVRAVCSIVAATRFEGSQVSLANEFSELTAEPISTLTPYRFHSPGDRYRDRARRKFRLAHRLRRHLVLLAQPGGRR